MTDFANEDEVSGAETEETQLIMPPRLRDPKLMSDYLKLPKLL
jgi:hypothetical protein